MIVHCCDFNVCEIEWQGKKGYVLYDCQLAQYRGEDRFESVNEFLAQYSVVNLEDIALSLSDLMLEEYGFDIDKVVDNSVLTYEECYIDDEDDDSIQLKLNKEQFQAFCALKLQLGFASEGNLDDDFIEVMNLARQAIEAQGEFL